MPPATSSFSEPTGCPIYIASMSQAALAIGEASGRVQIYNAVVNGNLPFGARLSADLSQARADLAAATASATAIGQPPATCGSLTRATITKPGIAVGTQQGARNAYLHVGVVVGGRDQKEFQALADENYPAPKIAVQRASYDALVKQLQSELGKQQLAVR